MKLGNNGKIAFNSIVIFIRLCVITIVSLITSRIILDALGASDYGLYNVVGGIVTFLNVINNAMISTTYRYIAFELGKKENGEPNKVFNASFIIHACFAILILIVGLTVGLWYINNYLNVEPGKIGDARFVFIISLVTTSVSTLFVPYQGLLVAYEKFSVNAIIDIATQLIKFGLIFLFIYSLGNRLRIYSLIMMTYTLLTGFIYFLYCKKTNPQITSFSKPKDKELYRGMLSYAFWTLFGAVSAVGKTQGSAILINFFFGTVVNAAFAVANQVEHFISLFAGSLGQAAVPQITKNYSGGNQGRSIKLTCYISKYTFIMMSMVAFPVLLDMDFLLGLWLKEVPEGTTVFCKLIVLGGLIGCLGAGIPALVNANGNIKVYQIITHSFILLALPITWVFYLMGFNEYTISVVYCIILFLSAFVKLYLLKRIFNYDVKQFFTISYSKMFFMSLPLIVFYCFYNPTNFSTFGHLIGLVGAELFLFVIIYILGTDKQERDMLSGALKRLKTKIL